MDKNGSISEGEYLAAFQELYVRLVDDIRNLIELIPREVQNTKDSTLGAAILVKDQTEFLIRSIGILFQYRALKEDKRNLIFGIHPMTGFPFFKEINLNVGKLVQEKRQKVKKIEIKREKDEINFYS